ncbi:MAG TPA: APC family permease [Bryobacteraceae bacterium]|nr:APC family permease [Bryobacteraceae bacterium]
MIERQPVLRRELRFWHLVLFNLSAIVGVRWLASAAHAGAGSLTLWLLAAAAFLVPSALVVASLSARFPDEGGLYVWTKNAFGAWHGFLCAWLYFISVILFLPTLLLAGISMAGYLFGATGVKYSEDPVFTIPVTLAALWLAFLANLVGLRIGKWPALLGGATTYLIVIVLSVFAVMVGLRYGSATHFRLMPEASWGTLNFWSQIALGMTGLELAPILGGEIRDPDKSVPRAAWISCGACALYYIAGTAALLVLLPAERISQLTGLAQAGEVASLRLGAGWASPVFALLITLGFIGQLSTYIAANTRLPFTLGIDDYLPPAFAELHPRWGTPHFSILLQAILATVLLLLAQLGENLRAGYQIMVDMVVISTLVPLVYIFASGFKFGQRWAGTFGGLIGMIAIVLSVVPPGDAPSVWRFELKVIGGTILLAFFGWIVFSQAKHA